MFYCHIRKRRLRDGILEGARLSVIATASILTCAIAICPIRARQWCAAVVVTSLTSLGLAHVLYVRFFGSLIPIDSFLYAHQLWDIRYNIVDLLEPRDSWLVAMPIAGILFVRLFPRIESGRFQPRLSALCYLLGIILCLAGSWPAVEDVSAAIRTHAEQRIQRNPVKRLGFGYLRAYIVEISWRTRNRSPLPSLKPKERNGINRFLDRRALQSEANRDTFGIARGANVLMVQIESLNASIIGAQVNGQEITPFLNNLRHRALYCPNILDQTFLGRSSDSEYITLNSQHPLPKGVVAFLHSRNRFVALPRLLREIGYSTLSAHAHRRGFWNRAVLHPRYGFETSLFRREIGEGDTIGWGLADGVFFDRLVGEITELSRPYFAFLITLSTHAPFKELPARYGNFDVGKIDATPIGNYLQTTHYMDASLKRFLEELEVRGALRDTIVLIYGDHTTNQKSIDHSELRRLTGMRQGAPSTLLSLRSIPLFFMLPGGQLKEKLETVGGLVDIAPTVLHFLGIERPRSFVGRLLQGDQPDLAVRWRKHTVVTANQLLMDGRCYDRRSGNVMADKACQDLEARGREELEISQRITQYNLADALR